jgi:preprotein translocase subunit SecG
MYTFLILLHVLISLALIMVVLLQSGKGTGLAGAFGGGGGAMGAVFGGRGAATFLSKLTTILAIAFFVSCLGHSLLASRRYGSGSESVIRKEAQRQAQQGVETPVPLVPPPAEQPIEGPGEGTGEVEGGPVTPPESPEGTQGQ